MGKLPPAQGVPDGSTNDKEKGFLPFEYFLAVPLLIIEGKQWRYPADGKIQRGLQEIEFEVIMEAFLHYSFDKANQKRLFVDIQGVCTQKLIQGLYIKLDIRYNVSKRYSRAL